MTADLDSRRARLRSDIALAARVLPTHYPLSTFIAVNPLAGLEGLPFEQAIRRASDLYGTRSTLSHNVFRELYGEGRITDVDLDGALVRRYPNLADAPGLSLGGRFVSRLELLRADLIFGTPAPEPARRYRTRSETGNPAVAAAVDAQTSKWCAAFFGGATWQLPGREHGFYSAWRDLAPGDRSVPRTVRAELRRVARRSDDAVLNALSSLGVADDERIGYLQASLTRMPGWAAHVQWCSGRGQGIDTLEYLAVRLTYEAALLARHGERTDGAGIAESAPMPSARERARHLIEAWGLTAVDEHDVAAAARVLAVLPVTAREMLWQNAFEAHYRDELLDRLACTEGSAAPQTVHTQMVCCIDTRSEGLRRHLESAGGYQTLGFAGFFAVAIRFTDLLGGAPSDLCPVLISPNHEVRERPTAAGAGAARRRLNGVCRLVAAESAFHSAKESFAAPFTLAEAGGLPAAGLAAAKTLAPAPTARVRRRLSRAVAPDAPTEIDLDAIPTDERVLFAQVALTTMGLTSGFGRLVVLCGHGSTTENNPFQAALDCGACGGQQGGPNARTAVAILGQRDVRDQLRELGIDIPADTVFVAAQHDTATDRVALLDTQSIPESHRGDIERLASDLARAGAELAAERCATLPGVAREISPGRAARTVASRAADWAQVYPEWGLAGNAAFIVAPREISRGMDLQRRAFLHSYDAEVDRDGSALETILTAPLVVAQWINCQYYFSTVSPEVFGAGTKTVHNVVGEAGVIAGHAGDLKLGLPWQSIAVGDRTRHEPMRLLAVIQAPIARIDEIIGRNPILQHLFGNDWLAVAAREHPGQPWQRWNRAGWRDWTDAPVNAEFAEEMIP